MPVTFEEVKSEIEKYGKTFHDFKTTNDKEIAEIKKHGEATAETKAAVAKLNTALDEVKDQIAKIQTPEHKSVEEDEKEHKSAIKSYLRKGDTSGFETKAMSAASDPNGGYLITKGVSSKIEKYVIENVAMRQIASGETISTDSLDILVDNDVAAAGWVAETAARTDTDSPEIGKKSMSVHELYAQPKATQKLIDDSFIDIEAWLAEKVGEIFTSKENTAFISGNGVGMPRGILTYAAGTAYGQIEQINSGTNGQVTADGLIGLVYKLKAEYARNGSFLMRRAVLGDVRKLKDGTSGQYLWQPALEAGSPDTLLGAPVYQDSDMPAAQTGSLSVAYGDFKRGYKIVDRSGIRVLRDPFTDKPYIKFYTTKRVGGDVVNFEAIKLLKLSS